MYFDFDFDKDREFFDNSISFRLMKYKIESVDEIKKIDSQIIYLSLKLWAEIIIKNNLDLNSGDINYLHLISEQNSSDVFNCIGKIAWKNKNAITDQEKMLLHKHTKINNFLKSIMFDLSYESIDICYEIKKEFVEFKNLNNNI